jgi:uncharacterized protein
LPWRFAEYHRFQRLDRSLLYHVETMRAYEVSPAVEDLVAAWQALSDAANADSARHDVASSQQSGSGYEETSARMLEKAIAPLRNRNSPEALAEAARALIASGFIGIGSPDTRPRTPAPRREVVRHLELMVTHACNLRCSYCFGCPSPNDLPASRHLYGSKTPGMSLETAQRGVEFLIAQSGSVRDLGLIFFGGEPLLAFPLVREITRYARRREAETGKRFHLSLSTNGLLLNRRIVAFLQAQRISCQVSIDGPDWIHDYARCHASGRGSHQRLVERAQLLIAARPGRVPARGTVSHGRVNLPAALEHLLQLGFGSAHLEPALGACGPFTVTAEDVPVIQAQQEQIARFFLRSLLEGSFYDYWASVISSWSGE